MSEHKNFLKGIFTSLITPFKNNKIDEESLDKIIAKQIKAKVNGLVISGTVGEGTSLSENEYELLIKKTVSLANSKIPIMVNAGSNSTEKSVHYSIMAQDLGAQYIMVIAPYYNKPQQEGIYQHFRAINDNVRIPIIIYNNPTRCALDINDDIIIKLAELENIIGIKDATNDLTRPLNIANKIKDEFYQFSGDDITALAFNMQGGIGCISTVANIIPEICVKLQNLWKEGNIKEAQELNKKYLPLYRALFCKVNPTAVKYAASLIGLGNGELRLPLVEINEKNKSYVKQVMLELNIL